MPLLLEAFLIFSTSLFDAPNRLRWDGESTTSSVGEVAEVEADEGALWW